MIATDAVRQLGPAQGGQCAVDIRRAGLRDLEQVMMLSEALRQHVAQSPTFLVSTKRDRGYFKEWLQNPHKAIEPLGCSFLAQTLPARVLFTRAAHR